MKKFLTALGALLLLAACGPIVEDDGSGGLTPGPVCYVDEDCAPNKCCGEGSSAVHVDNAPSCSSVQCSGTCDPNSIDCGCGIAICRDQRCTVARTVSASCPG